MHSASSRSVRRARAGTTLAELLVSITLSGIVLAAAGTMLLQSLKNDLTFRRQMNAKQNARTAADTVADDLKGAVRFTSLVQVGSLMHPVPTDTVINILSKGSTASIDDYTHPLTFDILSDTGTLRRVRYWRRWNSTALMYELRREVVADTLSGGTRTASESATAANAGKVIGSGITRFSVTKQTIDNIDTYDVACVIVEVTDSTATASVQANVFLRNNTVSEL